MAATRPPGGIESSEEPRNLRRPPRAGGGGVGESTLMDRAMAAATGMATKGRGAGISVKGASGATAEVRNLANGTSADDVQVSEFSCSYCILASTL